jgi:hypothetical protein
MNKEHAFKIFVKEGVKFGGWRSKEIFEHAWYSQNWDTNGNSNSGYEKKEWMTEEVLEAFKWYLDMAGRYEGRWPAVRQKGLMTADELRQFEKDVQKACEEKQHAQWESQRKSKQKRDKKLNELGQDFLKNMQVGEVYMVKFGDWWGERGMLVMEIDEASISGFYLDHMDTLVPFDAPKKEGYMYTKPSKYNSVKIGNGYVDGMFEWDGKTFKRTRTYETKMAKFIKRKIENPVVNKF